MRLGDGLIHAQGLPGNGSGGGTARRTRAALNATGDSVRDVLSSVLSGGRLGTAADRERFTIDGLTPAAVAFPESVDEVRAVLRTVSAAALAALPAGRGGHLELGMPPRRLDCVVSTARLDRVINHAAADMTVTVQAGVTLDRLAAALAPARQWLPVDPPLPSSTTVGGLIAANLNGLLHSTHGAVRDLLLGLTAIRADGVMIRSGGRVVKNVAGYDLHKAFVGALGTLGLIVEATFKVRPAPPTSDVVLVSCADATEAARLVEMLRTMPVEPQWLAVVSPGSMVGGLAAGEVDHVRETLGPPGAPIVIIGVAGSATAVVGDRKRIIAAVAGQGRRPLLIAGTEDSAGLADLRLDPVSVYSSLRDFAAARTTDVMCTITALPSDIWRLVDAAGDCGADMGVRFVVEPRVARMHVALRSDDPERTAGAIGALRALAEERRGHLTVRRAPPELKRRVGVWGQLDPTAIRLMERLKHAFDPAHRLCQGRFVAGL